MLNDTQAQGISSTECLLIKAGIAVDWKVMLDTQEIGIVIP